MNRLYKILILAAVSITVLALAGCAPQSEVDEQSAVEETKPGVEETAPVEDAVTDVVTLENITDEQLAEMTGFDVDFKAYMENGPSRIVFLKDHDGEMKMTSTLSIYSGSAEDSTALYIFEEGDAVVSAKLDEFVGSINSEGYDFDFLFYSFGSMMEKQPSEESLGYTREERAAFESDLKETYEGQPLYTLHEKLGVYVPVYRYEKAGSELKLNTYTIVSEVGYTASTDVNVVYNSEGTIKLLYLDDSYGPGKVDPIKILAEQE